MKICFKNTKYTEIYDLLVVNLSFKKMARVIVIGAGIAGLAAALRVRKLGHEVTVFEASDTAGGKIKSLSLNGYRFDKGPSLFTMPHLVTELFELYNEKPATYFNYAKQTTACNYFWEDGIHFSAPANVVDFAKIASNVFNEPYTNIENYLNNSKLKYDATAPLFLEKSLHKASTYLNKKTLNALLALPKLHINKTLNDVNKASFKNKKLIQLFNRYATYNGSSPYQTPGIMSMIPHLELFYGTYFPKGGMKNIALSLYKLAVDKGVKFKFKTKVEKVLHHNKKIKGVKTKVGEHIADLVISNADVFTFYQKLLKDVEPPKRTLKQEVSSSAIIFYWGINKKFPKLDLHNILFSENYQAEFETLFNKKQVFKDPTIYINISSNVQIDDAPKGCENWFVMVNTPGNFNQNWENIIKEIKKNVLQKINRMLGVNIEKHIVCEHILDPVKIEQQTGSSRGALYGASSNSKYAAFLRHTNFSRKLKGLYFCGGSVHPGGGIPLCLWSAKITANLIEKEGYA